jgi:hypothetical protein
MVTIHIHDGNWFQHADVTVIGGESKSRGLMPRQYEQFPVGSYAGSTRVDMPIIPRSEWSKLIQEMEASKSRLSDFRDVGRDGQRIPSRDQNGRGYCWMHSGCSALLLLRARDNMPYADLSAYMGACIIKNYRDEGGWGAQGLDWIREHGLPDSKYWPQKSASRSNDTPEMRANAKLHRVTEGWMDLDEPQYDRNLTFEQMATCLLCRIPVITDFNWWGHSVCAVDLVDGSRERERYRSESGKKPSLQDFELAWGFSDPVTAGTSIRIWNSWGDGWSDAGMGILSGSRAVPNGATAPRQSTASIE